MVWKQRLSTSAEYSKNQMRILTHRLNSHKRDTVLTFSEQPLKLNYFIFYITKDGSEHVHTNHYGFDLSNVKYCEMFNVTELWMARIRVSVLQASLSRTAEQDTLALFLYFQKIFMTFSREHWKKSK